MTEKTLVQALRRLSVETGSLACLGCGLEHNCSIHGCRIARAAADAIENQQRHIEALQQEIEKLRAGKREEPEWKSRMLQTFLGGHWTR